MSGPAEVVVVRNRWWLRLLAVPVFLLGLCAWAALVDVVVLGDLGVGMRLLLGLVLLVFAVTATMGGPAGLLLRETFSATEITVRPMLRTRRIELASASRIRSVRAAVRTGRFTVPIGRIQVVGDETRSRFAPRAILDETFTHAEEAAAVLDEWVRRRPELVADDPVARGVFEERGVLQPQQPQA